MEQYLDPKAVAGMLAVAPRTAQRWMSSGAIKSFRIGRLLRTRAADVHAFAARQVVRYFELQRAA